MGLTAVRLRCAAGLACALAYGAAAGAQGRPLRVGVDEAWPPHQFLDAKGNPTGFDLELFRAVAAVASLRYELVVEDWPTLRADLEAGRLDVLPGVFETPPREPVMDFSVPTAWVHHTVFVRMDSPVRVPADLLSGSRVLIRKAGPHDDDADRIPAEIELVRGLTPEELLRRLAAGEADAAVTLDTLGLYAIREHRLATLRTIGQPLDSMKLRFAVPEGRDELLATLNDGLAELRRNGTYDRIWDEWFGVLKPTGVPLRRVLPAVAGVFGLFLLALLWSASLRSQVARRTARLVASQQETRALERRLLQGEKMEALGRMAVGVAHDFRNVLTGIAGNVELARLEPDLPPRARGALDDAEGAAHTAAAMISQLVAYGSPDAAALRRTRWSEIASGCEVMLRPLLPASVALRTEFAADEGTLEIDPAQGQQIVMNLILNGRDAGATEITLSSRRVERDGRIWCELSVRDDGPGMDEDTRAHVFEPFYSTKGPGRGIGLATVRAVTERHGGVVEVDSQPGAGSCFRIRLPRTDLTTPP